jgi:hypothetical protein
METWRKADLGSLSLTTCMEVQQHIELPILTCFIPKGDRQNFLLADPKKENRNLTHS